MNLAINPALTILPAPAGAVGRGPAQSPAQRILAAVARHFGLSVDDLTGYSRSPDIALARQAAMYLIRERLRLSLKTTGQAVGWRDHGTVIHACKVITRRIATDPVFAAKLTALETGLRLTA
jgi:chromosomal replication initiator protein